MFLRKKCFFFVLLCVLTIIFVTSITACDNETTVPATGNKAPVITPEDPPPAPEISDEGVLSADRQTDPSPPASPTPPNNNPSPPEIPPQEFDPPQSGYWLEVSVGEQKVRIYQDGTLIKEWLASTGTADKPTPLGVFTTQNRGDWFYSPKYKQGAKWWVSFRDWGVYLFHTVPMDEEQNVIVSEADKLGTPASHGCVRLEIENAKWIYDNIPEGVPVYIHN